MVLVAVGTPLEELYAMRETNEYKMRQIVRDNVEARIAASLANPHLVGGVYATMVEFSDVPAAPATMPTTAGGIALPVSAGIAVKQAIQSVQDFVTENPVAAGATALGLGGAVATTVAIAKSRSSTRSTRRSGSTRRSASRGSTRKRKLKFGSPAWRKKYARKRGKKDRNKRGGAVRDKYKGRKVYRTKRGQPYILLASGKARFIRA